MHWFKFYMQGFTSPLEKKERNIKGKGKSLKLCTLYTVGTTHPETQV